MADLRPDLSTDWADLRLERAELWPKCPERLKKADLRPEGPGLMPERHDLKPDRPDRGI